MIHSSCDEIWSMRVDRTVRGHARNSSGRSASVRRSAPKFHPNRIEWFHAADELRATHGVGTQLKEQKTRRPPAEPTIARLPVSDNREQAFSAEGCGQRWLDEPTRSSSSTACARRSAKRARTSRRSAPTNSAASRSSALLARTGLDPALDRRSDLRLRRPAGGRCKRRARHRVARRHSRVTCPR